MTGMVADGPLLSLFIGARNDDYMGGFLWRLEAGLNYVGRSLEKLGRLDDVEVVVVDWGSPVPLHGVLALEAAARRVVRFVVVPPEVALERQGECEFPIVMVQNAAIRRCRGVYLAQTDGDILMTPAFLRALLAVLEGRRPIDVPVDEACLVSERRHVPWRYLQGRPTLEELDRAVHRYRRLLPKSPMFTAPYMGRYTGTGVVVMHRRLWTACRGYDERLVHWGWMDVDLVLRVSMRYPWRFLQRYGVPEVFHLDHYAPGSTLGREINPEAMPAAFEAPGPDDWGLAGHPAVRTIPATDADRAPRPVSALVRPRGVAVSGLFVAATALRLHWRWRRLSAARRLANVLHARPLRDWLSVIGTRVRARRECGIQR